MSLHREFDFPLKQPSTARSDFSSFLNSLGLDVLTNYVSLNRETQARNIAAWTPVCTEILQGFCRFEEEPVRLHSSISAAHRVHS